MEVLDFILGIYGYEYVGMSSSEWAAWVQAIGTILALGIAIAIPYFEHVKRLHEKLDRESLRLKVLSSLFLHIEGLFKEVKEISQRSAFDEMSAPPEDIDKLEQIAGNLLERLKAISLDQVPDETQVFFLLEIEVGLQKVTHYFNESMSLGRWRKSEEIQRQCKALIKEINDKIIASKALKEAFLKTVIKT